MSTPTKKKPLSLAVLRKPETVRLARIDVAKLTELLASIDPKIALTDLASALEACIVAASMTSAENARRIALAACWSRVASLNEPMPAKRREQLRLAKLVSPEIFGLPKTKPTTKKG